MRKPDLCICKNKGTDQLCCFRYTDSTIPLLLTAKISSLKSASVTVQVDLCQTWWKPEDRFSRAAAHLVSFLAKVQNILLVCNYSC